MRDSKPELVEMNVKSAVLPKATAAELLPRSEWHVTAFSNNDRVDHSTLIETLVWPATATPFSTAGRKVHCRTTRSNSPASTGLVDLRIVTLMTRPSAETSTAVQTSPFSFRITDRSSVTCLTGTGDEEAPVGRASEGQSLLGVIPVRCEVVVVMHPTVEISMMARRVITICLMRLPP